MILLEESRLSFFGLCPYLQEERCRFEYFYAHSLDGGELNDLLKRGWRKFGTYYFKPECGRCSRCIPIRILAQEFAPTKNQKRVMKKCSGIAVRFSELAYRDEIFEIYRDHSHHRFGRESSKKDFIDAFYTPSCPSMQSEYYLDGELIAVGFIDASTESLSSVYFVYKAIYEEFRLGTYSVVKEVEYAALKGLKYYYLGYCIDEIQSMAYKNHFHPNEKFDWERQKWIREQR